MQIPVLLDKDGIYKTFLNERLRKYVDPPPVNKSTLGLSVRAFSNLAQVRGAYPGHNLAVTSRVIENTKVAKEVPEDKVEQMQKLYEAHQPPSTEMEITDALVDKLADRILERLEQKLASKIPSIEINLSDDIK